MWMQKFIVKRILMTKVKDTSMELDSWDIVSRRDENQPPVVSTPGTKQILAQRRQVVGY